MSATPVIGQWSHDQYLEQVLAFHGHTAPGVVIGGYMVEAARRALPDGVLFDAVSETVQCLPDAIQLLTPCTIGNGWLRVYNLGIFALSLYDKHTGKGVRVRLDAERLRAYPDVRSWFLKEKPKKEQDSEAIARQIREGVSNIWDNVGFPKRFINNLLQGKGKGAFVELGRFCTNISAGFGVMDVAASKKVLVPYDPSGEDFGQTLGRWGIGHGVYIVWPFLGPSSLRESVGFAGDCVADPFFYVYPWELSTASELYLRFNDLEGTLSTYTSLRGIAVDPYIAVREAYISYRNQQVLR